MQHQPTTSTYEARQRLARLGGAAVRVDMWASFCDIEERLVRKGFPKTTDWWKRQIKAFYASGKHRLVGRVGRKGIKSTTCCRISINEVLCGAHLLRPGDLGLFMYCSENTKEAKARLFTLRAMLDALEVKHEPMDGDIRIVGRPLLFGVRAARVGAVSGPVVIGFMGDEVAKWRDEETGANPATEVLRSARPAMITQPNAHEFLMSSPWSTMDAHHEAMSEGDTPEQMVIEAATWVANPTVTEAETHALEKDHLTWLREYAAVPMTAGTSSFFDPGAVDAAVETYPTPRVAQVGDAVAVGADFGFRSDSSACCVAHRTGELYRVAELLELRPEPNLPLKPSAVVSSFAEIVKRHGAEFLMADGHYRQAIAEHLETHGLVFAAAPEGQKGKSETYVRARVLLYGGQLKLPKDDRLIRQLKNIVCAPTPGGGLSVMSPRKGSGSHGDIVSALVLAVWQRAGTEVESPKIPFGSPEYWAYLRSPAYLQKQEDASLEKDEDDVKRGDRKEWWDTSDQYARDM